MALTVVRWSPKALEMAFQTDVSTILFLIWSWIPLDRSMMCYSLKPVSLHQDAGALNARCLNVIVCE